MSLFDPAVSYVLRNEGGFVDNVTDTGGATNFGISLRLLQSLSSTSLAKYGFLAADPQAIKDMTISQAKAVYQGEFWNHAPFSDITNQEIANYIFDMAVNMGIAQSIKCTQRAIWGVLGRWQALPDDGILGLNTLNLVNKCGAFLIYALKTERGSFYRDLVQQRPVDKVFLTDWLNRTYNV